MDTKLYRNVDGEDRPFLVLHIRDETALDDLGKFTGGKGVMTDMGYLVGADNLRKMVGVGDFVVHLRPTPPFSRVRITLNGVRTYAPRESFMVCKPDEFHKNFEEVSHG